MVVVENHVDCIDSNNNKVVVENGISSEVSSTLMRWEIVAVICRRFVMSKPKT